MFRLGLISTVLVSLATITSTTQAAPLMTKAQYADYSVQFRCAEQLFHNDLAKKEAELMRIEEAYGLTEDNFDEFDELITEYERDDALLESISVRAESECSK